MRTHKNKILLGEAAIFLAVLSFLTVQVVAPPKAEATIGMVPFGGMELSFIPPIPIPPCPAHTIVRNYATGIPMFGIYALPVSQIYSYGNLFTPSVYVLGEYTPIPFPTCITPYPVFPIYQVGTGAL